MKEIELKILEIEKNVFEEQIKRLGAKKTYDGKLLDKQFDFDNNSIIENNNLFRLRRFKDKGVITFRDSKVDDDTFLIFEENEVVVKDPKAMEQIINFLGLSCIKEREKIRKSYKLGTITFHIDKFPEIPEYVQVEGPKNEIKKILKALKLSIDDTTNMTTSSILRRYNANPEIQKFKS